MDENLAFSSRFIGNQVGTTLNFIGQDESQRLATN